MIDRDTREKDPSFLDGTTTNEKNYYLNSIHELLAGWHYREMEEFLGRFDITPSDVSELYDMAQHNELPEKSSRLWNEYLQSLKVKSSEDAPFPFVRWQA